MYSCVWLLPLAHDCFCALGLFGFPSGQMVGRINIMGNVIPSTNDACDYERIRREGGTVDKDAWIVLDDWKNKGQDVNLHQKAMERVFFNTQEPLRNSVSIRLVMRMIELFTKTG